MHPIEHFCCQNPDCPDRGSRGKGNLVFRGWIGQGKRIRMVYCRSCKAHFSERKRTVLEQSRLPDEKVRDVLNYIREGCGTQSKTTRSSRALNRFGGGSGSANRCRCRARRASASSPLTAFSSVIGG
jgi:hypothetical protein